jgi:multiple antibiotic resistance protein
MELGINWKDIFTISMILFAVIDIVGSIPIIVDLRSKMGHIQSEKATIVPAMIILGCFICYLTYCCLFCRAW